MLAYRQITYLLIKGIMFSRIIVNVLNAKTTTAVMGMENSGCMKNPDNPTRCKWLRKNTWTRYMPKLLLPRKETALSKCDGILICPILYWKNTNTAVAIINMLGHKLLYIHVPGMLK